MSNSLYVAAMEPRSGKSLVVLGVMELLSRHVGRPGFFRPVIRGGERPDQHIELIRARYLPELPYESCFGLTHEDARRVYEEEGESAEALLKAILDRYKALERECDFVVCEGTDLTGVASAFEFDFNARIANLLDAPILCVANGHGRTVDEVVDAVRLARRTFEDEGCTIVATVANRVDAGLVDPVRAALGGESDYVVPQADELEMPSLAEIARALDARVVQGGDEQLARTALDYAVAAMHVPNLLDRIDRGTLVITPGDRADVILACLAAASWDVAPGVSGIVLTGGIEPEPVVMRVARGMRASTVPILSVETDTYDTVTALEAVSAKLSAENEAKVAISLGLFESCVDGHALSRQVSLSPSGRVTPLMFEYTLTERARSDRKHIVLPEGSDARILRASEILLRRGVVDLTLLGQRDAIGAALIAAGVSVDGARIVDPASSEWRADFARRYHELRKHKGVNEDMAEDAMLDATYFGTMMVHEGLADGMVSGAVHTTAHTIRPALEFIRTVPGCSVVSSVFLMCLADRVLVYGDCAVNPKPSAEQLADIAVSSAETARVFAIEPRVAMLSYSTGESGSGEEVEKIREATRIARERRPDLAIEGPIQYDAAVDAGVAQKKLPVSDVAGHATVFVFPDLNAGNNTYKAVQRAAHAVAIGPVLQGLNKPVNDLSRGCTVPDIVNTVAITAIQAQGI